jgi:shikimate kinase
LKKNLILTGMMGVGKSTIGKSLSERLNMGFIDTDKIIENIESTSIKTIFNKKGESYFRKIEKKVSLESLDKNNNVIALGGGAFMDEEVRDTILNTSISFWLKAETQSLLKFMDPKKRPLLNQKDLTKTLNEIYKKRKDTYNLANFKIDCDKRDVPLIVKKIVEIYESQ